MPHYYYLAKLRWPILESDESQRNMTILHEFAHFWLKHTSPLIVPDMTGEEILKQEEEADRLAHQWKKY